jgi:mannose-6-phosphate isomerase-like protein (cupin superfamily)
VLCCIGKGKHRKTDLTRSMHMTIKIQNDSKSASVCNHAKARGRLLAAAAGGALVCAATAMLGWPGAAWATDPGGLTTEFARGYFESLRVRSGTNAEDEDARVKIIAKQPSDVFVVRNTFAPVTPGQPGGTSGWHTHPGPSVVIVKSGTATVYDGDDPSCTPVRYTANTGFIDAGGGHVHLVRNEGTEPLVTFAFQIIPAGANRRIGADAPGNCLF